MFAARRVLSVLLCAAAAAAQDPLLQRAPADIGLLFVARDVLPACEAALKSPVVAAALAASAAQQRELFGGAYDAEALQRQLAAVSGFVPKSVVVAAPPATMTTFANAIRALSYLSMAIVIDRDQGAEAARSWADTAREAVASLTSLDLVVDVELRDERSAERLFDQAAAAARGFAGVEGVALDGVDESSASGGSVSVRIKPFRFDGGMLRQRLASIGLDVGAAHDPEFAVVLRQVGARLVLTCGSCRAGGLAEKDLAPLWREHAAALAFGQWQWGEAAEALSQVGYDVLEGADGVDSEGAVMAAAFRIYELVDQLAAHAERSSFAIVVDGGLMVVGDEELVGEEGDEELAGPSPKVASCLLPDEGPFGLSSLPFDEVLAGLFSELIERSERLRFDVDPFVPLIDYVFGEESSVFERGTLIVARPAAFRGDGDGSLAAMPFAAFAIVAQAEDGDAAAGFMQRLEECLVEGTGIAGPWFEQADLGVGVPTRRLRTAALFPAYARLRPDADFEPHWCHVDGTLVLSTDPALTRDLLARRKKGDLPRIPAGAVVDWTRITGPQLAAAAAGAARWVEVLAGEPRGKDDEFAALLRLVAQFAPSLGCEWQDGQTATRHRRLFRVL